MADISFRTFRHRGEHNADGWVFACYSDKAAQIIKEPENSANSYMSEFINKSYKIKSKIYISHVRLASAGSKSFSNTHPFSRELFGKEYIFAHNGTLHNFDLSYTHYKPIGQTDSEQAFCYIIEKIKEIRIID